MEVKLKLEGQTLSRIGHDNIVADSRNYLEAVLACSEEWLGIQKTAVFTHGERVFHVVLGEGERCYVPPEVIQSPEFTISVFGGDRITSSVVKVQVAPSGLLDGGPPQPETPDAYNQILTGLSKKADGLRYQNRSLQLLSQGSPVGEPVALAGEGRYVQRFSPSDWEDQSIRWELQIPAEKHCLGYSPRVVEVSRESGGGLENILYQWLALPNGAVAIRSTEAFGGRIIMEGM